MSGCLRLGSAVSCPTSVMRLIAATVVLMWSLLVGIRLLTEPGAPATRPSGPGLAERGKEAAGS